MTQSFGMTTESFADTNFIGDHPAITMPGTLASGGNLATGTVVGKVTATGKMVQLAPGASDGSETAAAILLGDLDASAADEPGIFFEHGVAIDAYLVWPDGITENQKATAIAQLKDAGIYVK